MLYERNSVEAKYRDHEIHYASLRGEVVTGEDAVRYVEYINQRHEDAMSLAIKMSDLINDTAALERAFGAPGQEGDPERLAHLAKRWNSVYGEFMDWAASVRGVSAPHKFRNLLELAARFADEPVEKYRRFVDEYVAQVDTLPAAIAAGEPVRLQTSLVLSMPDEVTKNYQAELTRLMRPELNRLGNE